MYPRILAIVLAGGMGARLHPLTAERSKPAVPFGGRYRIVDFVLSNLLNSGIHAIYLMVQYKSQSLIEHVNRAWTLPRSVPGQFVTIVPPQMREGQEWFQGTADAVWQNLNLIEQQAPDLVAVFGADHVYRMDVMQMAEFHRANNADVTVSAIPVAAERASAFGVIDAACDGRVRAFVEKPSSPPIMADRPGFSYASMGNYLFRTEVLVEALQGAKLRDESDFGNHILPRLLASHRVFAYDFSTNRVPGVRDYEEPAYWRDVGTLDAFFDANRDTLGQEPRFNLFNPRWIINSSTYHGPSPRIFSGTIENCVISAGALIKGGTLRNSILRREVVIEPDVEIEDCHIMDYCIIRRGSRLKRVIIDRYNEIPAGSRIGWGNESAYTLSDQGVTVIPKGRHVQDMSRYF